MSFRGDDRAQSIQIGAILLFATLVIALSLYQATVVPSQNQSIEYDAYQDASADMTELRNAMLSAAAGDGVRGVTVKTGAKYPSRVFLLNPLQPSGSVETTPPGNVTLGNVTATGGELANVGEYLTVEGNTLNYTTRNVRFDPDYNELSAADVRITNGFVYRNHSSPTPLAAQTLVRGNTISVRTVVGDLDADGYRTPITATPVSTHTNTVSVTNASGGDLTVTVPTQLSASDWEDRVLAGQTGELVQDVRPGPRPGTVTVVMEPGETYELQLSRVELRERDDDPAFDDPEARYLVTDQDRQLRTNSNGRVKLVVEARDALNNPTSNEQVTFSSPDGKFETESGDQLAASPTVRTNEAGNAVVYYNATNDVGTLSVTARLGTGGAVSAEKRVQYQVTNTVTSGSGGGGGGGTTINPGNFVVLDAAEVVRVGGGGGSSNDRVEVTLRNDGQTDANITAMRFSFYYEDENNIRITDADLYDDTGPGTPTFLLNLPVQGTFESLPAGQTISANGGTRTYQFAFDSQNGDYGPDHQNDFFIVEVVYNDAFEATYFVNFES